MPVPATPANTLPAAGVWGLDDAHASVVFGVPTVRANVATSVVPFTVALICTVPTLDPSVTFVLATPVASVAVVPGDTDAAPLVTVNVTVAPGTGVPLLEVTFTDRGVESVWPTNPTWPLPDTIAILPAAALPLGSEVPPPHAVATSATSVVRSGRDQRLRRPNIPTSKSAIVAEQCTTKPPERPRVHASGECSLPYPALTESCQRPARLTGGRATPETGRTQTRR